MFAQFSSLQSIDDKLNSTLSVLGKRTIDTYITIETEWRVQKNGA